MRTVYLCGFMGCGKSHIVIKISRTGIGNAAG